MTLSPEREKEIRRLNDLGPQQVGNEIIRELLAALDAERAEILRLHRIIAKELSENDELGSEFVYVNALKMELAEERAAHDKTRAELVAACDVIRDNADLIDPRVKDERDALKARVEELEAENIKEAADSVRANFKWATQKVDLLKLLEETLPSLVWFHEGPYGNSPQKDILSRVREVITKDDAMAKPDESRQG